MTHFRWFAFVLLAASVISGNSQTGVDSDAEDFRLAEIAANNIQTAITTHILEDAGFRVEKQLPEETQRDPGILVRKDGTVDFDWTPAQYARKLMEELRQGIHALQAAQKPRPIDEVALLGARKMWPKMRDISCRDDPGIRYYDLDGFEQYCPERDSKKRHSGGDKR